MIDFTKPGEPSKQYLVDLARDFNRYGPRPDRILVDEQRRARELALRSGILAESARHLAGLKPDFGFLVITA